MIIIRKVKKGDIKQVAKLQSQFTQAHKEFNPSIYEPKNDFSQIWKEYAIKSIVNENKFFILAEIERKIVGYAIVTISKRAPVYKISKIGTLDAITVNSNHRNKGIASKLLDKCLEWFKEHNINYVEDFVDSKNIGSLKLNKKFGFEEYQKRMILKL
jgi:ribosomal protein S18 acetylase RimI-like enzyme|tara:strand:+ start:1273 stop:1743 length:471 start_codon:yes stop_codon:yes gene_type:complete